MNDVTVTVGLYRHFKGGYYYVTGLSKSAIDEETIMVNYFDVCHPEYGNFVRPLDNFTASFEIDPFLNVVKYIKDRPDNVTGQHHRLERVKDLNFQIGSVSTEQLIEELRKRTDSPIHELDIKGLQSEIFVRDYVIGEAYYETEDYPRGVYTVVSFDTEEEAKEYFESHMFNHKTRIFKRTFIEVN